ncbi:MAG TPA: hypothetical protein VN669_03345 [Candidatus Acidoferrales bacterium]|jgi:hypothetical protein|nr:hypothetical protein [Candidatus Acidoferrales bacterium]
MAEDNEPMEPVAEPATSISLMRRQWLFLRHNWWHSGPLTPLQRVAVFLRGIFLVAVGCVGLVFAIAGTLESRGGGLDAIGKLMAEFMLIPIGLLALIVVGLGGSLIVRSLLPGSSAQEDVEHSEEA